MRKIKKISVNWPIKLCIFWSILSFVVILFCLIYFAVIDSSYANGLVDDVLVQLNQAHSIAQKSTVGLTKDAIAIAYQLGRLDFATFGITFVTVVIAIAGFAAFAGIKTTAIETTEKKILELLDDPDFEEKIRLKMTDDIHLKVLQTVKEHINMRESITEQDVGNEFNDYFEKNKE